MFQVLIYLHNKDNIHFYQITQKQYEEKVSKYDNEYKYYLEIRELDNLYTLKLTMKEVEALRHLINQNVLSYYSPFK